MALAYVLIVIPLYAVAAAFGEDRFATAEPGVERDWNEWRQSVFRMADRVPMAEPTWERVRQRYGLVRVDGLSRRLRGRIDGCPIELATTGRSKTDGGLRIVCKLRDPLPPGTCVRRRRGAGSSIRFTDVVLGATIRATSRDPVALAARLDRERVRQPLLEVIHAAPASRLTSDAIELEVSGAAGDPAVWLERVIALEQALRAA